MKDREAALKVLAQLELGAMKESIDYLEKLLDARIVVYLLTNFFAGDRVTYKFGGNETRRGTYCCFEYGSNDRLIAAVQPDESPNTRVHVNPLRLWKCEEKS